MREFETRRDPNITTTGQSFVSPEDWKKFHSVTETDGAGLTVVVMDSGIDATHPIWEYTGIEVKQPTIDGLPTDGKDNLGHGQAAASAMAIMAENIETVIDVPIFAGSGRSDPLNIKNAYDWMIDHADEIDMVNMSWGAKMKVQPIDTLHNELEQAGVDAIVAAGNTDGQTGSPATASTAFAVSACTLEGKMTRWSSPTDNVTALGRNIAMPASKDGDIGTSISKSNYTPYMNKIGGPWVKMSGTSFACPITAGMAATYKSVKSAGASVANKDVAEPFEIAFSKTAEQIKGTSEDGEGYVNLEAARKADTGKPPAETIESTVVGQEWANFLGTGDIILVEDDLLDSGTYEIPKEKLVELFGEK